MNYQVFKLIFVILCAIFVGVVGLKLANPNRAIVILNQGNCMNTFNSLVAFKLIDCFDRKSSDNYD